MHMRSSHRTASANIAVVGAESLDFLFAGVIDELNERSYRVHRYTDLTSLLADEQMLAETDILLTSGHLNCTRALMMKASRLRAIVSPFSGTEGFDEKAATELGIVIAHGSPPENFESMAEATVMLMLESLYDLRKTETILRENLPRPSPPPARMIKGKVIGLIGFGNIARAVAP
jgi:phosphoglycerate dehydrogenase-like enzyme